MISCSGLMKQLADLIEKRYSALDNTLYKLKKRMKDDEIVERLALLEKLIRVQPEVSEWIPFKEREADAEEREYYGCDAILDCKLPDEGEDIFVTYASGRVGFDTFLKEGYECYLDSGAQFISEAVAWMPLPEPYKEGDSDGESQTT